MFHARDGLYFEALPFGDVRIVVTKDGRAPDPLTQNILFKTEISRGTLASIMATACVRGYNRESFFEAYEMLHAPVDGIKTDPTEPPQ